SIFLLIISLFSLVQTQSFAQKSRSQLEKEKKLTLQKIKEAERILTENNEKKKNSIGQLSALNQQIQVREELMSSINGEIKFINRDIYELNELIIAMEDDLEALKKEYAAMVYATSKSSNSYDRLTFIFAASSFNQLVMRLKYMQQYGEVRKNEVKQINIVKTSLAKQRTELETKKIDQKSLLGQQLKERESLRRLKSTQQQLIGKLNQQEKQLKQDLANRQKALEELNQLIAEVIREEIRKKEAAKKKALADAAPVKLSSSFAANKRKLPWPVSSGFISGKFGKYRHPVLKGVMVNNDGIDIQTKKDETIRAVFEGLVSAVVAVPGLGKSILIQHGDYYTLYAGLKTVMVEKGQKITTNQALGKVNTDADGVSEIKFQVWKNASKLNPQQWLKPR
ncbi:murein hydrolase activator EnvC family protein, partial [Xanthovirga aplysinae]|uniref:murein hydrolase activator EnvC family protein n=1 Tax=Xanthovirga aplysinae TaxID=2529853 RepID=UPI0012BC3E0B